MRVKEGSEEEVHVGKRILLTSGMQDIGGRA